MPNPKGNYLGGVRDVKSLREHCRIDQETGCWRYGGACGADGISIQLRLKDGRKVRRRGRRAAVIVRDGAEPPTSVIAYQAPHCAWHDCVRPDHVLLGTLAESRAAAAARGAYDTPQMHAHLACLQQSKRKVSRDEQVAIAQTTGDTLATARAHGISVSRVKAIRRGSTQPRPRAPSVFEWRP